MDTNKKVEPKYSTLQNVIYTCKGIWKYDRSVLLYFAIFTLLSVMAPFINIFFPKFILEELLGGKRPDRLIILLAGFFISSVFVGYLMSYIRGIYYPRMTKIRFQYIRLHSEKCMTTDFQNTEDPDFLDDMQIAQRSLDYNDRGIEGMLHTLFAFLGSLITLIGYIAIISSLNIFVLLYLIANVLISYFSTFAVKKYEHSKKDEISKTDRRSYYIYNLMYDFSYGKEIRIFGLSDWISKLFEEYKGKRLKIHKQVRRRGYLIGLIDVLLLLIREGIIYCYLIYSVIEGRISIPDFTMYFATISGFANHLQVIVHDVSDIRTRSLEITDIRHFLERPDPMDNENPIPMPDPPYEFEFIDVWFKYPNSNNYIFKGLNLKIPSGQKLAIVGHNGAGKTTFIKLLCRLYDVTDGEILLNGINIKNFSKTEYYGIFSVVFQEILPLAFSVGENIGLDERENLDYDRIDEVLEQLGMSDKIETLKKGIDTSMLKILDDEGVEFSSGEKQRIFMARALYKDGDIMVFDEPTAALDPLAEYNIYMSFNEMVLGKTALYISHRLASTRFCDQIAMFEQGKLVEYGTHQALLDLDGKYADMFATQAKYYKESESEAI